MFIPAVLWGCEEYLAPDIDSQESYYVFDGTITNQAGPQIVKITSSLSYNDNSTYIPVAGAQVTIEEKDGQIFPLNLDSNGNYVTDSTVCGIINNEYRLHAIMPDGKEFYSSYEKLLPSAPIDSMSAEYYSIASLNRIDGKYIEETVDGIRTLNSTLSEGYTPFYRYTCDIVYQTMLVRNYEMGGTNSLYIYRPMTSYGNLYVANGNNYMGKKIIDNPMYFAIRSLLYYEFPSLTVGTSSFSLKQCGIFVKAKQYSLTQDAYKYWNAISKQQEASNYFFNPIESQVKGNMLCTSDKDELVFGFFGASALTEKISAFGLTSKNEMISRPVLIYPILNSVYYYDKKPAYFIDFNN